MSSFLHGILIALGLISIVFINGIIEYLRSGSLQLNPFPFSFDPHHQGILEKHFKFYRNLTFEKRREFEKRVTHFIRSKHFVPRNMRKVTSEMKVCIAASAIQLTYGLPKVYLSHFKYILVYPDEYYSTITKQFHKGEVNPRHQAIVLSWKSYVEGYAYEEGINLGLHEMAHALHLENTIRNEEFDFLPKEALEKWDKLADGEIEIIKANGGSFFRDYGAVDSYEFFAVAIENFFERPKEFRTYSPALYDTLGEILNQDSTAN